MSFQAYLDSIKAKTGKNPKEFRALAAERGLVGPGVKAGDVVKWLKDEFDLGRGHAMAIYSTLKSGEGPRRTPEERLEQLFSGVRSATRKCFETLHLRVCEFGGDVGVAPTDSYVSFVRNGKKFAIVQPAAGRIDIGIKRKGVEPTARFVAASEWNRMVTHRIRIEASELPDPEVIEWLRLAYTEAQ